MQMPRWDRRQTGEPEKYVSECKTVVPRFRLYSNCGTEFILGIKSLGEMTDESVDGLKREMR